MKRRSVLWVGAAWVAALGVIVALNVLTPLAEARQADDAGDIPAAEPARQQSAIWTVENVTLESDYPNGFHSTIRVESDAGAIERARLIWNSAMLRPSSTRQIFAEEGVYDPDTGTFTARWEPDALMMLPPWSLFEYHWELRDTAGNEFTTEPQQAEYADHTRDWVRVDSDAVIVYAQGLPRTIEDMVVEAVDEQKAQYEAVWGELLPSRPRVVLFGDFDAWLEWRTADHNTSDTSFVVGQTFDQWGVVAQVLYGDDPEASFREMAYGTVLHEIEHLYQAEFLASRTRADVPGWFLEGDATFFELERSYDYLGRVRDMAQSDDLPPLLVGVADGPRIDGENPREGYDIGYSFFVWLREQSGGDLSTHHDVMALLAENAPFFEALEAATGMSTREIERSWRVWLGATPEAPTLIPTWTPPAFIQPPTPMQFNN